MDDKTIIDITNLDAEKHAENAAKRVASYSEKLLHHASILSEKEYQKFLLERLEKDNGYVIRKASDFDRYFAVDREMLFKFLEDTQHETMEYLRKIYKSDLEETIVSFINAETTKTRGSLLDVLKHGIEISNQKLELMYTKPATTFNPDLTRKYGQNIFSAMEEVWASDKERIDVVIFLNGLAIIAFELKCNAAGQSYQDAIYQFRTDRSPKTRLFMFKAGTLVNFAMDLEEVYMTTKLAGDATFFLPFNMGNGEGVTAGAGNPAFEDKYSVSYMWEDILTKSLAQTANLLTSVNNFPARMITKFAEIAPEEVRSMYIELYDESKDLYERVASFKNKSNTLLERYGNGAAQHYQYENAIMTYLWLRYPDKYYIYKLSEINLF